MLIVSLDASNDMDTLVVMSLAFSSVAPMAIMNLQVGAVVAAWSF